MKTFKCKIRLNFLKPNICAVLHILNKHRNILFIWRCNFYENVGQRLFSIRFIHLWSRNTPDLKLRNQNKVSSEKVQTLLNSKFKLKTNIFTVLLILTKHRNILNWVFVFLIISTFDLKSTCQRMIIELQIKLFSFIYI